MSGTSPDSEVLFIDSHAHLGMPEFDTDRSQVIRRARLAGTANIINVGIDLASSLKSIELAQKHPEVLAGVGIHPQESKDITHEEIARLSVLTQKAGVVAIGEIGLDFHRDYAPREQQILVLQWQLELASEHGLPVVIHCRDAEAEVVDILKNWRAKSFSEEPCGVIHCFSGSLEMAKVYLGLGFYISLGAYIGYPSSRVFRDVVMGLPMDKLLLETDCPFLPPQSQRGQRNEPAYLPETAKELARTKEVRVEEVARQTTENARRLFRLNVQG